jgi:hypothetical protein
VLIRNPVAVYASILDYSFKGNVNGLYSEDRLHDLYTAPEIIAGLKKLNYSPNTCFVNYERLVENSDVELRRIFEFLKIDVGTDKPGQYKLDARFQNSNAVDKKSLGKHSAPVKVYLESWKEVINDSTKKGLLIEYVNSLGKDIFTTLGYDFEKELDSIRRHKVIFKLQIREEMLRRGVKKVRLVDECLLRLAKRINRIL